jgi:hypothetical protein
MWNNIHDKLKGYDVSKFPYDHLLCSRILDTSSEPFDNISKLDFDTFQIPFKKYEIEENQKIKQICNSFMESKRVNQQNVQEISQDVDFGKFLDSQKILQKMTKQMLDAL